MIYKHLLLLMLIQNLQLTLQDCNIPISSNYERRFPILLKNSSSSNYELIIPTSGNITIKNGEKITVSCPNAKNFLINSNSSLNVLTCNKQQFTLGSTPLSLDELQCKNLVRGDVKVSKEKCASNQGHIINIGYDVDNKKWITLIKVCYNNKTGNTFYSEYIIYSDVIKYASKTSYRPSFSTNGVGDKIAVGVAYKRVFQKVTFNTLLKDVKLAESYIKNSSYLSKGHLAPDSDFLFAAWQFITYFYINTNPQWQHINGGNWRRLESMVRNHASKFKNTITVYTGSSGVLQLLDKNNSLVHIYLLPDKILPVPKYFWKILYSSKSKEAIVFVNLNNPFVEKIEDNDIFCENICDKYEWINNRWKIPSRGVIFCCSYEEFKHFVKTSPILNVKNIMKQVNN